MARVGQGLWIQLAEAVSLDLTGSWIWTGRIDDSTRFGLSPERVEQVSEALREYGKPGGLLEVLWPAPRNRFAEAAGAALRQGRLDELVGLGPGLTPAGDDFITGALAVHEALPGTDGIPGRLSGTTPAGRTLLWLALRGSFPAYLVELVGS